VDTTFQFALAAFVAHTLERLKQSSAFSWITPFTDTLTKIIAAVIALISAVGITYAWDPTHGELVLRGLPTSWSMFWEVTTRAIGQYWIQKGYYLTAIKPNMILQGDYPISQEPKK
jgi:hypothetical protein